MSVGLILINTTKKQKLTFKNLPVSTAYEICSNHVSAKLVTKYLIENMGDSIRFIPDQPDDHRWPSFIIYSEIAKYTEVTEHILSILENDQCLTGRKKNYPIENDLETFYWQFEK